MLRSLPNIVGMGMLLLAVLCSNIVIAEAPLVVLFQKQKDPAVMKNQAERLASALSQKLGRPLTAQIPGDFAVSVQAIISGTADFAYVDSLSYLLAEQGGGASIVLAEERQGGDGAWKTSYDSVFVVRKDSSLTSWNDLKRDAAKLRIVFTSPTSTSGYVFPVARLINEGVVPSVDVLKGSFSSVSFGGSYPGALEQVLSGLADVAAVSFYTVEGAAATTYLPAEKQQQLRILSRTPGVPTHLVIARKGLDQSTIDSMREALLSVSRSEPALFKDIYGTARFAVVGPEHVNASRSAAQLAKVNQPTK